MLTLRFNLRFFNIRKMSIFTQNINPITGITAWEEKDPDYDYYQEIARSAFADMLHDHERNQKYYLGLKAAIERKHKAGEEANVLDIGTGTGLLSMMAAQLGADSIVACETFKPIAECAKKIVEKNGFGDKIKLIYKRSTKLTVGENGDLLKKANILVTEVFDTELIGEGALSTFKHAQDFLLEENSIVVPSSGTIWVQVVESPLVKAWNRVNPIRFGKNVIEAPEETQACSGASAVHDIQLSQLPEGSFKTLIEPQPIFKFDWTGKVPLNFNENKKLPVRPIAKGMAHAVFMWWDLNMDMDGQIQLSCAPVWAHPDVQNDIKNGENFKTLADKIPWRDHWMQAIYYIPNDCIVSPEKEVQLFASHDEYSFWFSLSNCDQKIDIENFKRPACECCIHLAFSRTRIGQWNDENRNQKYLESLRKNITPDSVCLCLTDASLLSLAIAKMGVKKLYLLETNSLCRKTMEMFKNKNDLAKVVTFINSETELPSSEEITFVFAEPYYVISILPWDNLHLWYLASKYPRSVKRIPQKAVIKAVAIEFKDLQKIRAPLGICEGFDMTIFDNLVQTSSVKADSPVEAQPLWEYPGKALCAPFTIASFNLNEKVGEQTRINSTDEIAITVGGLCNGIAIWVDWHLDEDIVVSSGPITEIIPGLRISWDPYTRQGVHLLHDIKNVTNESLLMSSFKFIPEEGIMQFYFEIKNK